MPIASEFWNNIYDFIKILAHILANGLDDKSDYMLKISYLWACISQKHSHIFKKGGFKIDASIFHPIGCAWRWVTQLHSKHWSQFTSLSWRGEMAQFCNSSLEAKVKKHPKPGLYRSAWFSSQNNKLWILDYSAGITPPLPPPSWLPQLLHIYHTEWFQIFRQNVISQMEPE